MIFNPPPATRGAAKAIDGRALQLAEQMEVSFPGHSRGSKQVADDEDRHRLVGWNYQWSLDARLGVDEVVASLAGESEPLLLENAHQSLIWDGLDGGHLAESDVHLLQSDQLRCAPLAVFEAVTRLFK